MIRTAARLKDIEVCVESVPGELNLSVLAGAGK
jgi:hypothetical protein